MFRAIMYLATLAPDKYALYTIWLPSIRANGIIYSMSMLKTLRLLEIPLFLTNLPVWKDMVYALLTQISCTLKKIGMQHQGFYEQSG